MKYMTVYTIRSKMFLSHLIETASFIIEEIRPANFMYEFQMQISCQAVLFVDRKSKMLSGVNEAIALDKYVL